MNHTSEPWEMTYDSMGGYDCMSSAFVIREGDRIIAILDCANYDDTSEGFCGCSHKAEAYARRIIAAVNACKSISTEELETTGIPKEEVVCGCGQSWESSLPPECHSHQE